MPSMDTSVSTMISGIPEYSRGKIIAVHGLDRSRTAPAVQALCVVFIVASEESDMLRGRDPTGQSN